MKKDYKFQLSDREIILRHFKEQYQATCELCGVHSEEAAEEKALYKKVFSKSLEECRDDIFNFYNELADAVKGHVKKCYGSDPSLVEMLHKLIKLEDRNMSEVRLREVSFDKEDLKDIQGCTVCGLTDGADEDGHEFILVTFFNPNTKKCIQLETGSDGEVFISSPFDM